MHPEYIQAAPRGGGWYIRAEDANTLEGGPFPSEEAAWAEIARLAPKEEPHHGSAHLGSVSQRQARRQ
jgi:hypothetical protein